MRIPFATNSYKHPSLPISAQQTINFYAEREPPDAKTDGQVAVLAVPGVLPVTTTNPTGPIRGMHIINNQIFVVSGSQLWRINALTFPPSAAVLIGSGITGSAILYDMVSMTDNGTQLIIVTFNAQTGVGGGWIWDTNTNTFQQITDPNFKPGYTVTFYDGYFIVPQANSRTWRFSNILNGLIWNPLDFNTAIVESSFIQGIVNQQENLMIFKQNSIETWYDTGNNDSPFSRYDGATIERGCVAPRSLVKEDNSIFFLGDDIVFYRLDGVQPRRVSTHALEAEWRTYPTGHQDTYTFSYTWNGHKFINLVFPLPQKAFVYDISTNLWHERNSYNTNGNFFPMWRQSWALEYFGGVLIGDAQTGQVGELFDSIFTEFGNQIVGTLVSPHLNKDRKRIFLSLFELDIETGVGGAAALDPQFMMQISRDGGRTYGNLQQWQSMGKQGAYQQRLRWKKLGQARQLTLKVQVSDPVPRRIIGASGEAKAGM